MGYGGTVAQSVERGQQKPSTNAVGHLQHAKHAMGSWGHLKTQLAEACNVVTYFYGPLKNTYDGGPKVCNGALAPNMIDSQKMDHSTVFLTLKNPESQPNLHGDTHNKWGSREP